MQRKSQPERAAAERPFPFQETLHWDNTNKRCTNVATGNLLIGAAVAAVDNAAGSTTGRVRLNGAARANEA